MESNIKYPSDSFLRNVLNSGICIILPENKNEFSSDTNKRYHYLPFWFEETENGFIAHHINHLPDELKEFLERQRKHEPHTEQFAAHYPSAEANNYFMKDQYEAFFKDKINEIAQNTLEEMDKLPERITVKVDDRAYLQITLPRAKEMIDSFNVGTCSNCNSNTIKWPDTPSLLSVYIAQCTTCLTSISIDKEAGIWKIETCNAHLNDKSSVEVYRGTYPYFNGASNRQGKRKIQTGWGQKLKSLISKLLH